MRKTLKSTSKKKIRAKNKNPSFKFIALSVFVLTLAASSLAFGETTSQYIDDATITTKVKAALLSDSQLKATQIKVQTNQGIVVLTGTLDNKTQEAEAVKDASIITGVQDVKDNIATRSAL
jgi:hyperosmotically inducible protein